MKKEMMYFFENRLKWENLAEQKTQALESLSDAILNKQEAEAKYASELFERIRNRYDKDSS